MRQKFEFSHSSIYSWILKEKFIKEKIDKYRKEFEEIFNATTRAELNSCRKEIEDKNKLIE